MTKLRREMGLRDVTLFAMACIIGTRWLPAAAHAGPGSVTLWLLAALLFVIPLAIAVATLIVKYPGAGGLYLWTRGDFGPWHGFLCFWMYWMGMAVWFPSATIFYMSAGLSVAGITTGRLALLAVSVIAIWVALGTNLIGVKIGKWVENLGAASSWALAGLLVVLAVMAGSRRGSATPMHILPHWDWDTVNFWSGIAYAMSGLELSGLMGAEMHEPERTLPRAGWIASGLATLFYAGSTVAMLVLLRPEAISELNGYTDVARSAASTLGLLWIAPVVGCLVLVSGLGQIGGIGAAMSRLPFAAGVDGLLPKAFARIHLRWGTPHYSILALGVVASFLLIAIQIGDTLRAAYQELVSLMVIAGFLPYLYIFGSAWRAGKRISPICGWAVTVVAILCSVVPTAEIHNVWLFEGKLALGTFAVISTAWLVYRRVGRAASPAHGN